MYIKRVTNKSYQNFGKPSFQLILVGHWKFSTNTNADIISSWQLNGGWRFSFITLWIPHTQFIAKFLRFKTTKHIYFTIPHLKYFVTQQVLKPKYATFTEQPPDDEQNIHYTYLNANNNITLKRFVVKHVNPPLH